MIDVITLSLRLRRPVTTAVEPQIHFKNTHLPLRTYSTDQHDALGVNNAAEYKSGWCL